MRKLAGIIVLAAALVAAYPLWKPIAKQWKWFIVATNIYQDTLRRTELVHTQVGNPYTSEVPQTELPAYLQAIDSTFARYEHYLSADLDLHGKHVLEIGPGHNVGVALRFVAAGADQVVAVDKFVPFQRSPFHRALYRAVRQQLGTDERRRFDAAIEVDQAVALKSELLTYISGRGIEEVAGTLPPDSIDVIVSNAVLEEVQPLDDALNALDRIWRAGGIQIHKIDLRDYGMFTKHGFHPLEFLTIPDGIYRYMSESAGAPNRHLVDYYRHKMMSLGYDAAIYTTWVLGGHSELDPPAETLQFGSTYFSDSLAQVRAIRPQLLPRYRSLPDEDLITQGILIVARKPRGPTKPLEPRS